MVTPLGMISEPIVTMQRAVAGSSTFQTKIGAANLTEALGRVGLQHWTVEDLPPAEHYLTRPFALVDYPQLRLRDLGSQCFSSSGSQLTVYYTMDHPGPTHNDGYVEFCNFVGEAFMEAISQGGSEGLVSASDASTLIAPRRIPRSERNPDHDFWEAAFTLTLE